MYQQILCPVDGSSTSDCGMTHAIALAKDQKAHLHFLHVVDNYFPIVDITGDLNYIDITERLREHGSTQLVTSTRGQIYKSILDYAEQCQADLIVMGTHGLRGVERLVMGSDAETIARTSPVPVLLVRTKLKTKKAKT
jgi:nucleotide-binding universal stress UspA family protein